MNALADEEVASLAGHIDRLPPWRIAAGGNAGGGAPHGRVAYPLAPKLEDLLRKVAAGTPVIVLQNLALDPVPV